MGENLSIDKYISLLKDEKELIEKRYKINKKEIELLSKLCQLKLRSNMTYDVVCDNENMYKFIKSNIGKNKFIDVLKAILVPNLFDNKTIDGKENFKYDIFDINDLDDILKCVYGVYNNYEFKLPRNWNELGDFLRKCYEIYYDKNNLFVDKRKFNYIITTISLFIANSLNAKITKNKNAQVMMNLYNKLIKAYKNDEEINLTESEIAKYNEIINAHDGYFTTLELTDYKAVKDDIVEKEFLSYCNIHNNNLSNKKDDNVLNDKKVLKKIDKYYNTIINKKIEDLENINLPKYSNKNYKIIANELLNKLSNKALDNEEYIDHYTIMMMHYMGYFKNKYKDSEKLEKVK